MLVLLGDRYGWRPVPATIPAPEFESILDVLGEGAHRRLIEDWYRRDDNAVPVAHVLRPRGQLSVEQWSAVERDLHEALVEGAVEAAVEPRRRLVYEGSATHQEIDRGVLSVQERRDHVVCLLRTIDGLPADSTALPFVDIRPSGEPDEEARRRLATLRDEIRRCVPDTTIEYKETWSAEGPTASHIAEVCASTEELLWSAIEIELDAAAARDEIVEEANAHRSFAAARVADAGSRPRDPAEGKVLEYLSGESRAPLVLTGPGCVGKTTFAAQLVEGLDSSPNFEVFARFVGVSSTASSVPTLLASLAREAGRRYGAGEDVPSDYAALVSEFWARLDEPPAHRRTVLVVDGVDLLAGRAAPPLDWIATRLPSHVRVLVTAAPGPTLDLLLALPNREVVELPPLVREDGGEILDRWLAQRGRTLQPDQRSRLLDRFAPNGLPLYLRIAVEAAARWRSDAPVNETRLAADVTGIVKALLRRLSRESEHGPVLVSRALAYVACARNGLAEDELLAVLGDDDAVMEDLRRRAPRSPPTDELPTAVWARLLADLGPYLAQRRADGAPLLGFFHRAFAEVVDQVCVGSERPERHDELARFFSAQPLESVVPNLRALAELPYQLAGAGRGSDLVATLTDYGFLDAKLRAVAPQPLLDDFALPRGDCGHSRGAVLDVVAGVLERAAALLAERPDELAGQLHGRLLDVDDDDVRALLDRTRLSARRPWLRPLTRSLGPIGGPLLRTIATRGGDVQAVALTPNAERVLAACRDGSIEVWDIERGELERTLYGHEVFATCVSVAPDGHVAVSGARVRRGEDPMELRVWDLDQGRPIRTFDGPDHDFGAIAVLPGGGRAVGSSYDGTVRVWDLATGTEVHRLTGHAWYVRDISVSADGRLAASGADDGTIRIWDLERGEPRRIFELDHHVRASSPDELPPGAIIGVSQVTGVALSPDGRLLVSASPQEGLSFWNVEDGALLGRVSAFADYPVITRDGRRMVLISARALEVWDPVTRERLARSDEIAHLPTSLAVSADGTTAVTGGGSVLSVWSLDRLGSGQTATESAREITAVAIVPDEPSHIAVVATRDPIEGWCLDSGQRLWRSASGSLDLVAIPGRPQAVIGRIDGGLDVVDARTGAAVGRTAAHRGKGSAFPAVKAIAIAPNGETVAAAADQHIDIWNIESGTLIARIRERGHDPKALGITPDGSTLVSLADRGAYEGEHNLKLWDLATGRNVAAPPRFRRSLRRVRRPPDRRSSGQRRTRRDRLRSRQTERSQSARSSGMACGSGISKPMALLKRFTKTRRAKRSRRSRAAAL
ncbi:MAG: hypothetical protein ACXVRK_14010 [Gaiellaceae bacterium]